MVALYLKVHRRVFRPWQLETQGGRDRFPLLRHHHRQTIHLDSYASLQQVNS
jgi:hypothetical protein